MKETEIKSNRRAFFGKITAATLGLTVLSELGQGLYANPESLGDGNSTQSVFAGNDKKFVPVMITPFLSNSKIDYDNLSRLIDFYEAAGAKGYFANCLSSEMYHLDPQERLALTKHVVKQVNGKYPVVSTGSFGDTILEKANFSKKIQDLGADATILITSHFAEKQESDAVLISNFEKFFALTGDMKLGTYECPSPYKRVLSPKVYQFLVSNKNMVYHKDTSEDIQGIVEKLRISKGSQLEFYNAHTASGLKSLQSGGRGMSPISGNFYPEIHSWLCENANNSSKAKEAIWIQNEIAKMEPVISSNYPISAKYFLQKRGIPMETISRKRKGSLTTEQKAILDNTYKVFLGWCKRLNIEAVKG